MSHENIRQEESAGKASDRAFGGVMASVFLIVAALPLWSGGAWRVWALAVAGGFCLATAFTPALLAPLNRLWMAFGERVRRLVSPVMLVIIFYGVLTPMGLLMRLLGKDPMRRSFDTQATSYWIPRDPPGPKPESFVDQF